MNKKLCKKTIHSANYKKLLRWLKSERKSKTLTMRELASKISVHHSIIWNIENAERRLDVVEYVNYCKALGVDAHIGISMLEEK